MTCLLLDAAHNSWHHMQRTAWRQRSRPNNSWRQIKATATTSATTLRRHIAISFDSNFMTLVGERKVKVIQVEIVCCCYCSAATPAVNLLQFYCCSFAVAVWDFWCFATLQMICYLLLRFRKFCCCCFAASVMRLPFWLLAAIATLLRLLVQICCCSAWIYWFSDFVFCWRTFSSHCLLLATAAAFECWLHVVFRCWALPPAAAVLLLLYIFCDSCCRCICTVDLLMAHFQC